MHVEMHRVLILQLTLKFLETQDKMLDRCVINQYSEMDQLLLSNPTLISTTYPSTGLWAGSDMYTLTLSPQHMMQCCWFNTYVLSDPLTN